MRKFVTDASTVYWHPRVLWVGIGCVSGTSQQLIEMAIQQVFRENQLAENAMLLQEPSLAIAGIATIDTKSNEVGLVELCREWDLPLKTFPSDVLRSVCVPNPSKVVEKEVGTPSVAEAAALCAILDLPHANVVPRVVATAAQSYKNDFSASSLRSVNPTLLVPKQIFRLFGQPGAVTVAVAQAETYFSYSTVLRR